MPELNVEAYTEILVVMDRSQITSKKITKGILDMACFRQQHVVINFETVAKFERAISQGQPHHCLFCGEENLVFSGSPYRLQSPTAETLDELKTELSERLDRLFPQADIFLLEANRLKGQSSNLTALMLHHCLAYFYRTILFLYTHKFYNTHRLAKLHSNIARFFPQIYFLLSEGSIKALDDTNKWLTAPLYPIDEIWDTEGVFEEVAMALKVTKAVIEKQAALLSGGSGNLEQSGNSEKTVAKKKKCGITKEGIGGSVA